MTAISGTKHTHTHIKPDQTDRLHLYIFQNYKFIVDTWHLCRNRSGFAVRLQKSCADLSALPLSDTRVFELICQFSCTVWIKSEVCNTERKASVSVHVLQCRFTRTNMMWNLPSLHTSWVDQLNLSRTDDRLMITIKIKENREKTTHCFVCSHETLINEAFRSNKVFVRQGLSCSLLKFYGSR